MSTAGRAVPALVGRYVFGDFCCGMIWSIPQGGASPMAQVARADTSYSISSFGEDELERAVRRRPRRDDLQVRGAQPASTGVRRRRRPTPRSWSATSTSSLTWSPTSQPPASRATFQSRPQSLRLTLARAVKPARRAPSMRRVEAEELDVEVDRPGDVADRHVGGHDVAPCRRLARIAVETTRISG